MTQLGRTELVEVAAMAAHLAAWSDLAARCLEPSVFNEPAFALPAARFIPSAVRPRFLLVWDGPSGVSRLIGLCVLAMPRVAGLPTRAWLHKQATAAFPLLDRDYAEAALAAMLDGIGRVYRPAALVFAGLPEQGCTLQLLRNSRTMRFSVVEKRERAVIRRGGPVPTFEGRALKELRRQGRRLAEEGAVLVHSARSPDDVSIALERFLALEAAGWKGRRGTALARSPALAGFVRAMAPGLARSGQCRIDCLTVNDRPLAAGIMLRSGSHAYYWKTAYDEAYRRLSPGVQLTMAITEIQQREDVVLTDSCAVPDHVMIGRLWRDRMVVVDLLVGPAGGSPLAMRLSLALERGRRRLKRGGKRLLLAVKSAMP